MIIDFDDDQQSRYESGTPMSTVARSMALCDCELHRLVMGAHSEVLDYGRATRVVSVGMWSSLAARDLHCRFPNCDRPARSCDAHHVQWFSNGGVTNLENLVLMCRRHHRLLHKGKWRAKLNDYGGLEVTGPDGTTRITAPGRGPRLC